MKQTINNIYDSIKPLLSDDELIFNTLRKAETMENNKIKEKRRFGKPLAALCAVVTAAAAGTVTVGAAYNWDFQDFYHHIFSRGSGYAIESALVENMGALDFTRFGKALDETVEFEGGRIKLSAVLSDGINAELLFNVEFDEPERFEEYSAVIDCGIFRTDKESGERENCCLGWGRDTDVINGTSYEYLRSSFESGGMSGKYLEISFNGLSAELKKFDSEQDKLIADSVELPFIGETDLIIDMDFDIDESMIRTADINGELTVCGRTLAIDSLRLSPIMLSISSDSATDDLFGIFEEISESNPEHQKLLQVRTADGALIKIDDGAMGAVCRDDGTTLCLIPVMPFDTSTASAVVIGDVEIALK